MMMATCRTRRSGCWVAIAVVVLMVEATTKVHAFLVRRTSSPRLKPFSGDVSPQLTVATIGTSLRLNFFRTDQPLEERLAIVQKNWEEIKNSQGGAAKFFLDEIIQAEKAVVESLAAAEKAAELAIAEQRSKGGASDVAGALLNDLVRATQGIAEAVATAAASDASGVADLRAATDTVVESIQQAERAVQSVADQVTAVAATSSSIDGPTAKAMTESLETSAAEVIRSMKEAESVAGSVDQAATADAAAVTKLVGETGSAIAKSIAVAEGRDGVPSSSAAVADSVIQEMRVAEAVAENVAKAAQADASGVSSLEGNAAAVVESIQAVESAVERATATVDGSATVDMSAQMEALKVVATDAIQEIQKDERAAEAVAGALAKDASTDAMAVEALRSADTDVNAMMQAASDAIVDAASKTATTVSESEASSLVESKVAAVAESIQAAQDMALECSDCAIQTATEAVAAIATVAATLFL